MLKALQEKKFFLNIENLFFHKTELDLQKLLTMLEQKISWLSVVLKLNYINRQDLFLRYVLTLLLLHLKAEDKKEGEDEEDDESGN